MDFILINENYPGGQMVVFRLIFATFLTLVIIPVMYKITVNISKMFNTKAIIIRK